MPALVNQRAQKRMGDAAAATEEGVRAWPRNQPYASIERQPVVSNVGGETPTHHITEAVAASAPERGRAALLATFVVLRGEDGP